MPLFAPPTLVDTYSRRKALYLPSSAYNPLIPGTFSWTHAGWAADPSWSNPGDGNAVSSWRNQSGGGDPAQATAANKPTYRASGIGSKPSVQFDGTDSLVFDIADVAQSFKILVVFQAVNNASPTTTQRVMGRGTSSAGDGIGKTSGNIWVASWGTGVTWGATDTNPHVVRDTANGASSQVFFDGSSVSTANQNTGGLSQLVLGAGMNATTPNNFFNGHIGFWGVCAGSVADADLATVETYLRSYYGF